MENEYESDGKLGAFDASAEYLQSNSSRGRTGLAALGSALPLVGDKWLLSSALQKLVRRGIPHRAVAVALRLHMVDEKYLARRLPIIAVEDIGIGDLKLCEEVLSLCSTTRWWRGEAERTIAHLVAAMAGAVKSRAACDALCLADVHPDTSSMVGHMLTLEAPWLVKVAADRSQPRLERMNALRVLGGITVQRGARYQTISRCNRAALVDVAAALELSACVARLMSQNAKTANLAAMLPIALEAFPGAVVREGGGFPHALEEVEGIPLCGVDMFSEVGRGALREFFSTSPRLRRFASAHIPTRSPVRLFNMAMFYAESAVLDRYVWSPALEELTSLSEQEEMRHLGMVDPSRREELREILVTEAHVLTRIRRRRLASQAELFSDGAGTGQGGAR